MSSAYKSIERGLGEAIEYANDHQTGVINEEEIEQIKAIRNFASNILDNTEDLDPEITKIVSDNLWDLYGD